MAFCKALSEMANANDPKKTGSARYNGVGDAMTGFLCFVKTV